ncbi:hypothetical protein HK096_003209, partial [Nowakowskiella sp. JEL0078]
EPYSIQGSTVYTRFLGLGSFPGSKERWFYAMNLIPLDTKIVKPSNVTPCPFVSIDSVYSDSLKRDFGMISNSGGFFFSSNESSTKRNKADFSCNHCLKRDHIASNCPEKKKTLVPANYVCRKCNIKGHWVDDCPLKSQPREGYICKICGESGHFIQNCSAKQTVNPLDNRDRTQCWFCLSNPNLEKHLLIGIGEYSYITLAKGGLVDEHILIVPIEHISSSTSDGVNEMILEDAENLKRKIANVFMKNCNKKCIVFEVFPGNSESSKHHVHMHFQVVPVPNQCTFDKIAGAFYNEAKENGLRIVKQPRTASSFRPPFCHIDLSILKQFELCNSPKGEEYLEKFYIVPADEQIESAENSLSNVPLMNFQIGRLVLAKYLGTPNRTNWKKCCLSEEEEKIRVAKLRDVLGNILN